MHLSESQSGPSYDRSARRPEEGHQTLATIDAHAHAIVPDALAEMAGAHPEFGPSFLRPQEGVDR